MPQLMRIKLPEAEAGALSRIQRHLDALAQHARTFTAAAEMLSFAQQRAEPHEAKFQGDNSVLGVERRGLLSEWQMIAVREGAMTLFHFAEAMSDIAASLGECPTLSASIDQMRLDKAKERFRLSFPGFKALGDVANNRTAPASVPQQPNRISFSQTYSADHIRVHAERNNIFRIGDSRKYIARAPGEEELLSYSLDSTSVYELREIAIDCVRIFSAAVDNLSPKWAPEVG